jgi:rRNA maturation endonuclease Nob1
MDTTNLILEADGIAQPKVIKKTILEPINCFKCGTPNAKTNKFCFLCGTPIDDAAKEEQSSKREFMAMIFEPDVWKLLQSKMGKPLKI